MHEELAYMTFYNIIVRNFIVLNFMTSRWRC